MRVASGGIRIHDTCTVYYLVYIHVQYIIWFIYMYSISPGLYTCTVYHLVYIHVQYIIWFIYMYSISPRLHTVHDITKRFGTWKLVYTIYKTLYTCIIIKMKGLFNPYSNHMTSWDHINQCCLAS